MSAKKVAHIDRKHFVYRSIPSRPGRMLGTGSYPKVDDPNAGYYRDYCKDDEYCGVYLVRGSGMYRDSLGNSYPLREGDFFHRFPGVQHQAVPERGSGWLELFVALPVEIWEGWRFCLAQQPKLDHKWNIGVRADMIREFVLLQNELESCADHLLGEFVLHVQQLLLRLYRISLERAQVEGTENSIHTACQRLKSDLSRTIVLEELAEEVGLDYETFRRRFKQDTGVSPGAYRNRQRIEKACQMLRESAVTNAQIAQQLGYSDGFVFSRQFKKSTGRSPSDFARDSF